VTPEGKLLLNPHEQRVITLVKRLRSKGYGYKLIAKYLNEKGYKTKKGKRFTHMQVKRILEREYEQRAAV